MLKKKKKSRERKKGGVFGLIVVVDVVVFSEMWSEMKSLFTGYNFVEKALYGREIYTVE